MQCHACFLSDRAKVEYSYSLGLLRGTAVQSGDECKEVVLVTEVQLFSLCVVYLWKKK